MWYHVILVFLGLKECLGVSVVPWTGWTGSTILFGVVFRAMQTVAVSNVHGTLTWLDCRDCPVTNSMSDKEMKFVLADIDNCS